VTLTAAATLAPSATSTPEPTATLTATPIPIPEGAVKTADGSTVFVKEGKLWQVDAQGKAAEKDILDVTFANVLDGSEMVRQLHPEYYENDQKLLKETLLPKGGVFNKWYKESVEGGLTSSSPEYETQEMLVKGVVLELTRVSVNGKDMIVLNSALVGLNEPLSVIIGTSSDGREISPFIRGFVYHKVGADSDNDKNKKVVEATNDLNEFRNALVHQQVGLEILRWVSPKKLKSLGVDDWGCKTVLNEEYCQLEKQSADDGYLSLSLEVAEENDAKSSKDKMKTSSEWIAAVIAKAKARPDGVEIGFLNNRNKVDVFTDQ
jgi:hypothetical protein